MSFAQKLARAQRISKSTGPSEDEIHVRIVARLRDAGLTETDFFHAPNGGRVSQREAARRKARGVAAGVPDLVFTKPPPNGVLRGAGPWRGYPDCAALELKKPGGRLSKAQTVWLEIHRKRGWAVAVSFSEDEAIRILQHWGYLP